jgi:putative MATE family efflux protein
MKQGLLNDKRFWKNALKLALPVAIQNMLFSSFTLADTLLVSTLGDVSLSAVGMSSQWSMLMNLATFGICSGTGVFVSQYWGIKDEEKIHKTMGIALSAAMLISFAFFSFSFLAPHIVIGIFNKDAAVIGEGKSYIGMICFVYPALAINDVLSIVLRSCEKVKLPMLSSVVITGLNIFLDYCLIFGKLGFEKMGVKGAALATVIATWAGTLVILSVSLIQKNILIKQIFFIKEQLQ